jgi:hypothetical protein
MAAAGLSPQTGTQQSYFGFEERNKCMMPDGISYVEHVTLTEGARRHYLDRINREVSIKRATGDMHMKMQTGSERMILLEEACVDWNFINDKGERVTFSKGSPGATFNQWLDKANPKDVDIVEKDIRKKNPWLMSDLTADDIRQQISELEEMLDLKVKEEEGKAS